MSDEPIDNDVPDQPDEGDNEVIRTLRQQAKEGKAAATRAAELERKLAFIEAGVDTTKPGASYFVKGYDGPLDPEAIKAEAVSAGFLPSDITTSEPQPQGIDQTTRDALAAIGDASNGPTPEPVEEDLYADFRGATYMETREDPQNFAMRLAKHLEDRGEPVSYEGGQRKPARTA